MKTDSIIKSIVAAVKSKEELKGINCVYSQSRNVAENPVCSFTLCIGLGKAQYTADQDTSGSEFTTEIKLCLLAPSGAGGKQLSEMALWVAEAVCESLSVSRITVSEPKTLDTGDTLYSDIVITVEDVSLADTEHSLYIDENLIEGVELFEAESSPVTEKKPELLKGYSIIKTGEREYNIKLKSRKPLKTADSFELKAAYADFEEVYFGCFITKLKREFSKYGEASFIYSITAQGMRISEKEVQYVQ